MKVVRREFTSDGHHIAACFVYCPACKRAHRFIMENDEDPENVWDFDGDMEFPTFNPSLLVESGPLKPDAANHICHSFLKKGVWDFLGDCTHDYAGNKTQMVDFPEDYRV